MKITLLVGFLVLAVLISGCTSEPETTPQPTQPAQITQPAATQTLTAHPTITLTAQPTQTLTTQPAVAVEIKDFKFNPASITVPRGTSVIWTQFDSAPHTVTSVTSKVLDSPILRIEQTYSHTFNEAGTFEYYCTIHPSMKGTVIVT